MASLKLLSLLCVFISQVSSTAIQQIRSQEDLGNVSSSALLAGRSPQDPPTAFFMPVICQDPSNGPKVSDCQSQIMNFFDKAGDNGCTNVYGNGNPCSPLNVPQNLGDFLFHSCIIGLCGPPDGMPNDSNCQLLAVAAQEIISTCSVNGQVRGSVVFRQPDSAKAQTISIGATPHPSKRSLETEAEETTDYALPDFAQTTQDQPAEAEIQARQDATAAEQIDAEIEAREDKYSDEAQAAVQARQTVQEVEELDNSTLARRGVGLPGTSFTLRIVGQTGNRHMVIDQATVDRQVNRLLQDSHNRPHSSRLHSAVPFNEFDNTIDLDFQMRDGFTKDIFSDQDLHSLDQAVNDQRNANNNPGVFAALVYNGADQSRDNYRGMALWQWNNRPDTNADQVPLKCQYCLTSAEIVANIDNSLNHDPDTNSPYDYEYGPAPAYGPSASPGDIKVGQPRGFTVQGSGSNDRFTINSLPYPNGRGGQTLLAANPNAGSYDVADTYNCEDTAVTDHSNNADSAFVTEHILELNFASQLLSFIATGRATRPDGSVYAPSGLGTVAFPVLSNYMTHLYTTWDPHAPNQRQGSLVSRIFELMGSTDNPSTLVNAERALNSVKARIWQGQQPMSDELWHEHRYDDVQGADACERVNAALSFIRLVISTFEYLNNPHVNTILSEGLTGVSQELGYFSYRYGQATGTTIPDLSIHVRHYIWEFLIPRMENTEVWVTNHLSSLRSSWTAAVSANVPGAADVLRTINNFIRDVDAGNNMLLNTRSFPPPPSPNRQAKL